MRILFVMSAIQLGFSLLGEKYLPLKGPARTAAKVSGHGFTSRITAMSPITPSSVDISIKHNDLSDEDEELVPEVTEETELPNLTGEAKLSSLTSPAITVDQPSVFIFTSYSSTSSSIQLPTSTLNSKSISSRIKFPSWHSPRGENDELIRELVAGYATIIGLSPLFEYGLQRS